LEAAAVMNDNEKTYRIHWRSLITGATGHGTATFTKAEAEAIAADLNLQSDNKGILTHWAEKDSTL